MESLDNVRMKPLEISIYLFNFDGLDPLLLRSTNNRLIFDVEGFEVDID